MPTATPSLTSFVLAAGLAAAPASADLRVAMLEISGAVTEMPAAAPLLGMAGPSTISDYVDILEGAADDGLDGLIIRLKDAGMNLAQAEELGRGMKTLQDAGTDIWLFAEGYGPLELVIGAMADHAMVQHGGGVMLPGLYIEEMYMAETLAWAGVEAQLVQVGDYKGANEQLTRSKPSEAWSENIEGLLDGMYGVLRSHIMNGRGLNEAQLDSAMEAAWMADADTAIDVGLIDSEVDLSNLVEHIEAATGETVDWQGTLGTDAEDMTAQMMSNPFAMFSMLMEPPVARTTGPTIAVLHLNGAIVDGAGSSGGLFGGQSAGSRTLRNAMKDIQDDDNIEGVIVRIDSPGGSAIASEVIHFGLRELAEEMPVWVSIGSMAASGGYYTAVAGDKIYINPSSIVGSIGVVGGKISMEELYDNMKIGITTRSRGPKADMFGSASEWSQREVAEVRRKMAETYDKFVDRVETGRPDLDIAQVGEGRLFVGPDAVRLGMADELGGLGLALEDLADELDLDEYGTAHFPTPPSFSEVLEEAFGGFVTAPSLNAAGERLGATVGTGFVAGTLRELLGADRYDAIKSQLSAFEQLRTEPVLLTMPAAIRIK